MKNAHRTQKTFRHKKLAFLYCDFFQNSYYSLSATENLLKTPKEDGIKKTQDQEIFHVIIIPFY